LTTDKLILWDSPSDPPTEGGLLYTWDGHSDTEASRSLFCYVEANASRLRRKYLAFIHYLGEFRIDDKRITEHLKLSDGLSYWWLTRLTEKDFSKTPLDDLIRLFAFEEILTELQPRKLVLVSPNGRLMDALAPLCRVTGISCEWHRIDQRDPRPTVLRKIHAALPATARALLSLVRYLLNHWPLRRVPAPNWFAGKNTVCFFSYFEQLEELKASRGRFHPRHWNGILELLEQAGLRANWVHRYIASATSPSPRYAVELVLRFNQRPETEGRHSFLGAFLSWNLVLRVLLQWLWLVLLSRRLNAIREGFRPPASSLDLWPLLRRDWLESMRGPDSLINLLEAALLDRALRTLPRQSQGFYLCENLPWERALAHFWRKHGHGRLVAVVHSTIRFWDLRYFVDARTANGIESLSLPRPDRVAVNSKPALDAFHAADYPSTDLLECEALRYAYLLDFTTQERSSGIRDRPLRILVVGDFLRADTHHLLHILSETAGKLDVTGRFSLKPHPNCPVKSDEYPTLNLQVLTEPLGELFGRFDLVCSCSKTSAALDAYLAGLPVIVVLDDRTLNYSPLRGQSGSQFVSTPKELAEAFRAQYRNTATPLKPKDFFYLDSEFPRWRHLLSTRGAPAKHPAHPRHSHNDNS